MHDFGRLVYLDMQKTGSTLTSDFLQKCCKLDEIYFDKHAELRTPERGDVFYFTTVRNVTSCYVSLFLFGCAGHGDVRYRLEKLGRADLYAETPEAFNHWMRLMMQEEFLSECYPNLKSFFRMGFGLQSTRHLCLSLSDPLTMIETLSAAEDVTSYCQKNQINDLILRNKQLDAGLQRLSREIVPDLFDQDKVVTYFSENRRMNTTDSPVKDTLGSALVADVRASLAEKEFLLLDLYGQP